jgi:hypothetical protein
MMNRRLQIGLLSLFLLLGACSGSSHASDAPPEDDPRTPCSTYVEAYARCQAKLGAPQTATGARVDATRGSLTAHLSAAKTDEAKAKLARECETGLKQLRAVCP